MDAYRDERNAALYLNEHLEQDVRELTGENGRLRSENQRLSIIARELLRSESDPDRALRMALLEERNARLEADKLALLRQRVIADSNLLVWLKATVFLVFLFAVVSAWFPGR